MFELLTTQSVIDHLYKRHITKLVSSHDLIKPQSKTSIIEGLVISFDCGFVLAVTQV